MPRVREQETAGYAHCADAWCSGSQVQTEVPAVRVETAFTYAERGGDAPGEENSHVTFRFVDEQDRVCPVCEKSSRDLTGQKRPVYQPLSAGLMNAPPGGFPQDGLLHMDKYDAAKDPRVDDLQAQIAELRKAFGEKATA